MFLGLILILILILGLILILILILFLASGPEPGQNRPQEADFEHFWPQAQNLARIGLRRLILSISGLRPRTWPE